MKNGRLQRRQLRIRSGVSTGPAAGDPLHPPWTPAETDAILTSVEHVSTCQTPRARSLYLRALIYSGPSQRAATLPQADSSRRDAGDASSFARFYVISD